MEPLLTVVTINWNNLAGLQKTVQSLRRLPADSFQHVVVDGASTDGSAAWMQGNRVSDDTTVISEPDNGIYDAMNKGLALAVNPWVMFLNSGDTLALGFDFDWFESQVRNGGARWAYGRAEMVWPDGVLSSTRPRRARPYSWRRQVFWRYEIGHQAVFMETAFVRGLGGFDGRLRIAADYRLTTLAGQRETPLVLDTVVARIERGGVSDERFVESLLESHRVRAEVLRMSGARRRVDLAWTHLLVVRTVAVRALARVRQRVPW